MPFGRIYPLRRAAALIFEMAGQHASLDLALALLQDPDTGIQSSALSVIGAHGKDATVPAVLDVVHDHDEAPWIRGAALKTLGKIGSDGAIRAVFDVARNIGEHEQVRSTAIVVLGEYVANPTVEMLAVVTSIVREEVQNPEPSHDGRYDPRVAACKTLLHWVDFVVPDGEFIDQLVALALGIISIGDCYDDEVGNVDEALLCAFKKDFGQVQALIAAMHDESIGHRRLLAASLLERMKAPVPPDVFLKILHSDADKDLKVASARVLGACCRRGALSSEQLVEYLLPLVEDVDLGWSAFDGLAKLGWQAPLDVKEGIIEVLRERRGFARNDALEWIAEWPIEHMPVNDLLYALANDDGIRYTEIVTALTRLGERIPIETFIHVMLNDDPDSMANYDKPPWARVYAAMALGNLGERAPVDALLRAVSLEDTFANNYIRAAALEALGKVGGQTAIDAITAALHDETDLIRAAAAKASAHLGEHAPKEMLLVAVGDSSDEVRKAALAALEKVAPELLPIVLAEAEAILRGDLKAVRILIPVSKLAPHYITWSPIEFP